MSANTQICNMFISKGAQLDQVSDDARTRPSDVSEHVVCQVDEVQIFAGYASLIIIYGCLGDTIAQKAAVRVLQGHKTSIDMLEKAVQELLKLHINADRIGLDASQTSSSELRTLLSEIQNVAIACETRSFERCISCRYRHCCLVTSLYFT